MSATAEQIRQASRVRLLAKMSKAALMKERERVFAAKGKRVLWEAGKPSKDEIIHEILEAEGLL